MHLKYFLKKGWVKQVQVRNTTKDYKRPMKFL